MLTPQLAEQRREPAFKAREARRSRRKEKAARAKEAPAAVKASAAEEGLPSYLSNGGTAAIELEPLYVTASPPGQQPDAPEARLEPLPLYRPSGRAEASEIATGEIETGEIETGEPETGEIETGEPETGETEAGESETGEKRPGEDVAPFQARAVPDRDSGPAPPDPSGTDGVIRFEADTISARPSEGESAGGAAPAEPPLAGAPAPVAKREGEELGGESGQARSASLAPGEPPPAAVGDDEGGGAQTAVPAAEEEAQEGTAEPGPDAEETGGEARGARGGGGGGASELAAWKSQVAGATAATPEPTLDEGPAQSVATIGGAGKSVAARRRGGGSALTEDAKKAVRKPPETPKQLPPPPPTPVPAADKAIADASDKKLPDQSLPQLVRRPTKPPEPESTMPEVDTEFAADIGSKIDVPGADPAPEAPDKKSPNEKQHKKLKEAKDKEPEPGKKGKPGQAMTLTDTAPPPTPGVEVGTKGQSKEKVAQVLAELVRSPGPEGEAEKIVTEARGEAYPRKALEKECPEMGVEKKDDVLAELKTQVDSIRAIAGISAAELDAAIKTREENLKALETGAKVNIETATKGAKKETKDSGEKMAEDIAGARDAVDEDTLQKMIAASGEGDPKVIELRRDKAIRDLTSRAARQDVYYEQSGDRRARALDAAKVRMRNAYKKAAEADEKQIRDRIFAEEKKATGDDAAARKTAEDKSKVEATPIFAWTTTQVLALDQAFVTLKLQAAEKTKTLRSGIKVALYRAKDMLRGWAEDRISRDESWLQKLIRRFKEWMREATDDSAAWEAARNEQLRDALVGDLQLIDDLQAAAQSGVDMKTLIEERGLDQAQMTVLQTYFSPVGPKGKQQFDAIGAVAAGMRMRVRVSRKPGLISWFKSEVMGLPDGKWRLMGRIGNAEKPPFNVFGLASELYQAMDQWGTDEDQIFRALAGLTPLQARAIRACYKEKYKRSLDEHLESEMGGAEMTRAEALLEGNQTIADVATLYEAMHGGLTGAGTDEDAIMTVLRNKTPEEREAIVAEYKKRYGIDLEADLKSELDDGWGSDHDAKRADALMEGDTAKADAIALDAAMHGGLFGTGTDEAEITRVYEQNRAEVEAEAAKKGWSTAQMDAEIKRRNEAIEKKYEVQYGDPGRPEGQPSALRQAFAAELSGAELGLANALADADMTAIDSAKLGVERESFITSDETVNKILQSQHERAQKDVTRDVNYDLRFREEMDSLRGVVWTPEKRKAEREAADKEIKEQTKKRALTYMGNLETAFDKDWGGGEGGLVLMIAFNMSGTDQQKAFDLRAQGGHLEPEQEIYYAVEGVGTDVDKLKEVLKGKSPEEIQKIRQAWVDRYGGDPQDFDDRILEEVGGRDYQDIKWGLKGEPQTLDGKLARAKERMEYEKDAYGVWGDYKEERASLEEEYRYLEEEKGRLEKLEQLKAPKGDDESEEAYAARLEEYSYWEDSFKLQQGYFDQSIENHRKAVDSFADTVATVAGIVAVVIVMAVVAFFTAGTGAVAIGAALASAKVAAAAAIAAAAATMASKALIKGSAYSRDEIALDAVIGAVDAVASAMTAGIGGGLLKAARAGAPASKLAAWAAKSKLASGLSRMATSERMAARMFAGAMAEGIEGVASSLPSALAGNMLDEKNWVKGNPLANILQGTAIQTGIGTVVSGGMGGLGGIGKHVDDVADNLPAGRETGDILGKRGSPADRLALWKGWSAENPGKPYNQFLEQLDSGVIAREADDAAAHALQRQMRGELLSAIPPSQRGEFADVPIHVMSDADFERFTRSATGQAVVIFKDGKPMVILREGADIKALREEGIHLLQSKDPKFAGKFADLDETRLADWERMGLDEQLALYRNKLDIELDGQARLIKGLDEQIAAIDDPALRKALTARRDAAVRNLDNLKKRLGEVDGLSPADRLKMARGKASKPQYLDQKPRLFSKLDDAAEIDPEFAGPLARRTAAKDVKKLVDEALKAAARADPGGRASAVIARLKTIWVKLSKRTSDFLDLAADKVLGGKRLADIVDEAADRPLFDATTILKSFAEAMKELSDARLLDRLDQFVQATERLLNSGLYLGHFERFIAVAAHVGSPDRLFALVEKLASLTSFRLKSLKSVAAAIDNVARHGDDGPARADKFMKELSDLADLTKKRDAISKADQRELWDAAQKELDDAGTRLKDSAGAFGIGENELGGIIEEMSKSGRFNWKVFKETLSEKYPLSDETFKPFFDLIEEVRIAVGKDWQDLDVGPLRWWGIMFEKLHADEAGRATMVARIKAVLLKELPDLNLGGYGRYRRALKEQAIDHIFRADTAAEQLRRLTEIMKVVRERDPASIGEYFAAFRRKIFEKNSGHEIQGDLAGAVDVELGSRTVADSARMVDGAIDVPETGPPITNGPRESGRYFVEDKAGESFDLKQAEFYSQQLDNGTLKTSDPGTAKGLIYFVEDPVHAEKIAAKLKGMNENIFVATFGPDGTIVFVPRPAGKIVE